MASKKGSEKKEFEKSTSARVVAGSYDDGVVLIKKNGRQYLGVDVTAIKIVRLSDENMANIASEIMQSL